MFFPRIFLFACWLTLGMTLTGLQAFAASATDAATYKPLYPGTNTNATSCITPGSPQTEGQSLVTKSINVNLTTLTTKVVSRLQTMADNVSRAIMSLSAIETNNMERLKAELTSAQEKALKIEQVAIIDGKTLEATQDMEPTPVETSITDGLSFFRPELQAGARQAEMKRYIAELNNVPLDNKFRDAVGSPLPGYVDTSISIENAMGYEFRNFVKFFCDARSLNGRLASTKYLEYNVTIQPTEYWCGQERGMAAPNVTKAPDDHYIPLADAALASHVKTISDYELSLAKNGAGSINLVNAPKNVAELYFEPRSLSVKDVAVYEKAEQEFARMVIGRADNLTVTSDFSTGEGQRDFMNKQGRIAKLALARYPFADMFSQKMPTMPEGSAAWAAKLIEANIGDCTAPKDDYKQLCNLTKQLRAKKQISESEFYDVLFNRQFQGMAFSNSLVKMTKGQLKRTQDHLLGLQLALGYLDARQKEQQLALMAAIYAE